MKSLAVALALASSVLGVSIAADYTSRYDGIKVLRVPTVDKVDAFDELIDSLSLQRWKGTRQHIDVEVPADKYDDFLAAANSLYRNSTAAEGVEVTTMHDDLGASIREETAGLFDEPVYVGTYTTYNYSTPYSSDLNIAQENRVGLATDAWFNSYHPLADHTQFLRDLVSTFPKNSAIVSSGTSGQGRDITGINIFGSGGSGSKPAIVIHGTVHAREWIGTMVSLGYA